MPVCAICEQPIFEGESIAMHEAILSRGDVQGMSDEVKKAIMVKENCVLLHNDPCHLQEGHTKAGRQECINYLIRIEGREALIKFLEALAPHFKSGGLIHDRKQAIFATPEAVPV